MLLGLVGTNMARGWFARGVEMSPAGPHPERRWRMQTLGWTASSMPRLPTACREPPLGLISLV